MNATVRKLIQDEIDQLIPKCADISELFNSNLKSVHCSFKREDPYDSGFYADSMIIPDLHIDLFKQFIQSIYVHYDKELRDLQTLLADDKLTPEPGPIIKTHVSEDPGQDPADPELIRGFGISHRDDKKGNRNSHG